MKAAYFTFETTGSHFDRDSMVDFAGIKYDHGRGSVMDKIHYQVVGDMAIINGTPMRHHEAVDMLHEWMMDDCYYFTVNADKKKHFLRSEFFHNYLNPYMHERSSSIDKIVDFMELMRVAHFLGRLPFEVPVSPLGEVSYEIEDILRVNFPGRTLNKFMALTNQKIIESGGEPFRFMKTRAEKTRLLSGRSPIVTLTHIDKALDVSPEIILPIARSEGNNNRFYVWRPSGQHVGPSELLQDLIEGMQSGGVKSVTKEMKSPAVFFIDVNKAGIIASLDEIPSAQKVPLRNDAILCSRLRINYSEVVKTLDKLEEIKEIHKQRYAEGHSVYDASLRKRHIQVGKEVREAATEEGIESAMIILQKNRMDSPLEVSRLEKFCRRNDIAPSVGELSTKVEPK